MFYVKIFIYQRILIVYAFDILFWLTWWNVSANQDQVISALNKEKMPSSLANHVLVIDIFVENRD